MTSFLKNVKFIDLRERAQFHSRKINAAYGSIMSNMETRQKHCGTSEDVVLTPSRRTTRSSVLEQDSNDSVTFHPKHVKQKSGTPKRCMKVGMDKINLCQGKRSGDTVKDTGTPSRLTRSRAKLDPESPGTSALKQTKRNVLVKHETQAGTPGRQTRNSSRASACNVEGPPAKLPRHSYDSETRPHLTDTDRDGGTPSRHTRAYNNTKSCLMVSKDHKIQACSTASDPVIDHKTNLSYKTRSPTYQTKPNLKPMSSSLSKYSKMRDSSEETSEEEKIKTSEKENPVTECSSRHTRSSSHSVDRSPTKCSDSESSFDHAASSSGSVLETKIGSSARKTRRCIIFGDSSDSKDKNNGLKMSCVCPGGTSGKLFLSETNGQSRSSFQHSESEVFSTSVREEFASSTNTTARKETTSDQSIIKRHKNLTVIRRSPRLSHKYCEPSHKELITKHTLKTLCFDKESVLNNSNSSSLTNSSEPIVDGDKEINHTEGLDDSLECPFRNRIENSSYTSDKTPDTLLKQKSDKFHSDRNLFDGLHSIMTACLGNSSIEKINVENDEHTESVTRQSIVNEDKIQSLTEEFQSIQTDVSTNTNPNKSTLSANETKDCFLSCPKVSTSNSESNNWFSIANDKDNASTSENATTTSMTSHDTDFGAPATDWSYDLLDEQADTSSSESDTSAARYNVDDFILRRRRLRSESQDSELWEGLPSGVRYRKSTRNSRHSKSTERENELLLERGNSDSFTDIDHCETPCSSLLNSHFEWDSHVQCHSKIIDDVSTVNKLSTTSASKEQNEMSFDNTKCETENMQIVDDSQKSYRQRNEKNQEITNVNSENRWKKYIKLSSRISLLSKSDTDNALQDYNHTVNLTRIASYGPETTSPKTCDKEKRKIQEQSNVTSTDIQYTVCNDDDNTNEKSYREEIKTKHELLYQSSKTSVSSQDKSSRVSCKQFVENKSARPVSLLKTTPRPTSSSTPWVYKPSPSVSPTLVCQNCTKSNNCQSHSINNSQECSNCKSSVTCQPDPAFNCHSSSVNNSSDLHSSTFPAHSRREKTVLSEHVRSVKNSKLTSNLNSKSSAEVDSKKKDFNIHEENNFNDDVSNYITEMTAASSELMSNSVKVNSHKSKFPKVVLTPLKRSQRLIQKYGNESPLKIKQKRKKQEIAKCDTETKQIQSTTLLQSGPSDIPERKLAVRRHRRKQDLLEHQLTDDDGESRQNTESQNEEDDKEMGNVKITEKRKLKKGKNKPKLSSTVCTSSNIFGLRRKRGPALDAELLANPVYNKHACVLWSSEHRRHYHLLHPEADFSQLDNILRKHWEELLPTEKIRYFNRARDAVLDEYKHSKKSCNALKQKSRYKDTDVNISPMEKFCQLNAKRQKELLSKWLYFYQKVLTCRDYKWFIADVQRTLRNIQTSQKGEHKPLTSSKLEHRKLLFDKINKVKPKVISQYMERCKKNDKANHLNQKRVIQNLIKGLPQNFPKGYRAKCLTWVLEDLRELESKSLLNVTGIPKYTPSYTSVYKGVTETTVAPSTQNSDTTPCYHDNYQMSSHERQPNIHKQTFMDISNNDYVDKLVSNLYTINDLPVLEASTVEQIFHDLEIPGSSPASTSVAVTAVSGCSVISTLHKEAQEAFERSQAGQRCCELDSPSCVLSTWLVADRVAIDSTHSK